MGFLKPLFAAAETVSAADIAIAVAMLVLTVIVALTAVWLLSRFISKGKGRFLVAPLVCILAGGLVIRLVFSLTVTGFREDISRMAEVAGRMFGGTLTGYYAQGGTDIYPISFYVLGLFGGICRAAGLSVDSVFTAMCLKLPLILADVGTALILYLAARRFANDHVGLVLAGLYMFCPAFFVLSGIWGNPIVLLFVPLLLSLYMLVTKRSFAAIMLYSLCLLIHADAMYLYPAYLLYYGWQFIKAVRKAVRAKKSAGELWRDKALSAVFRLPLYFVLAFFAKYLVSMPFAVADFGGNPFAFVSGLFLKPLVEVSVYSQNGISIYNIFTRNGVMMGESFPIVVFVSCFAVLVAAIGCIVYLSKKNRAVLVLYAAFIPYTLVTYYFGFSLAGYMTLIVLLLLAFLLIKDRRILQVIMLTAFCFAMTAMTVLAGAGYLNSEAGLMTGDYPYLTEGFGLAVMIIGAVVSVAGHIYLTLVLLDISMSNNRRLLTGHPAIGYFAGVKRLFKDGE
ncbi:MAG: hypothetical protein LBH24_02560 [Clostridiales bacterium]|jgi:Gpi18-like mannosyltransferase|nr:hypothetical protein [Clostridiales bacterium]